MPGVALRWRTLSALGARKLLLGSPGGVIASPGAWASFDPEVATAFGVVLWIKLSRFDSPDISRVTTHDLRDLKRVKLSFDEMLANLSDQIRLFPLRGGSLCGGCSA